MENQNEVQPPQDNLFAYVMSFLVLILLSYTVYIYLSYDFLDKGELEKNYIKKNEVSFYLLSDDEQSKYISKSTYDFDIKQLNNKLNSSATNCEPKIVEKIVEKEVPVVKTEYKTVYKDRVVEPKEQDKDKKALKYTAVFKCYDMLDGSFYQSNKSIDALHKFLDKNKDAKYFEVIGIISNLDFRILKDLKNNNNSKKIDSIDEFAQLGLSRKRVIEGTWNIKKYLGENTDVQVVNYTITSDKNHKGFVVRVYK